MIVKEYLINRYGELPEYFPCEETILIEEMLRERHQAECVPVKYLGGIIKRQIAIFGYWENPGPSCYELKR